MTDQHPPDPSEPEERLDFTREFLPPPNERLTPEAALEWLLDDFPGIYAAVTFGFDVEDEETGGSFGVVAIEVGRLYRACITAVASQKPVRVRMTGAPGDLDYDSDTDDLARVVAQRCRIHVGDGGFEYGFEWLADVLKERIAAAAEHSDQVQQRQQEARA